MSSRDVVLGRIRAALGDGAALTAEIPRRTTRRGDQPADLDLLVHRLEDYKVVVHRGVPAAETVATSNSNASRAFTARAVCT